MIRCTDLSLVLNSRPLLGFKEQTFESNMIHIIQGENGCGKSSLFRCLIGWLTPNTGSCQIKGSWVYQPQQFHLFGPKVMDNFHDHTLAAQMLVALKAENILSQSVKRLSGGERQKVALVRTLCMDADVYLLDEPTSYMDESSRLLAYHLIKEQLLDQGKTVLMIDHASVTEPFDCGKIYLLKDRKLDLIQSWTRRNVMHGKVMSICISEHRGLLKSEVSDVEVTHQGILGDGHSGNWDRQITILNYQSYISEKEKHPQLDLHPGSFAENIMIDGIDFSQLKPGSQIQLGETVKVEVSQIGKEDHPSIVTRTYGISLLPYEGLFCKVINIGRLSIGDKVTIL